MPRYDDIDPMDIDPDTGRPYSNYSSPSLDTSFHDHEMEHDPDAELADEIASMIPPPHGNWEADHDPDRLAREIIAKVRAR